MTRATGKFRRFVAIGLTAWLMVFYVSIHGLHRHARVSVHGRSALKAGTGTATPVSGLSGECPVCLFLSKHTAEPPGIPPAPVSGNENAATTNTGSPPVTSGLCCAAAAPRAPPRPILL